MLLAVWVSRELHVKNWAWPLVFLAAVCMACYQPLFFTAVKETGIAVGTVIAIGSAPIIAGPSNGRIEETPAKLLVDCDCAGFSGLLASVFRQFQCSD